jgi:PHP family Zn ribbon phosphoesterase
MTPNNIVNMSKLLGFDIIALTDHNTVLNCPAVAKLAAQAGLCFLPGMELSTSEEIHVVCLFASYDDAYRFFEYVRSTQMQIPNKEDIYGEQIIMDENDIQTWRVDGILWIATGIGVFDVKKLVEQYNGVCFPAHIDRKSNSLLSSLGDIPPECGFNAAEVYETAKIGELSKKHPILNDMFILSNSDAHSLEKMREPESFFELEQATPEAVLNFLRTSP